ncbi:MAG TPA: hypothetical protein VFS43_41240 [Polyangiaceae bacterium]|nr:hypothetical protein [Polyangiaceae bacterium]
MAAQPATKARDRPNGGRASKKGAGPARPTRKGGEGDEGGEGDPGPEALVLTGKAEGAFGRVEAEIDALPAAEARRITVYVPAACVMALGALPKLLALREAMVSELVNPPLAALDKLEDYALAAAHAHAEALPESVGESELRALLTEAVPLRERLLVSAEAAATCDLLDGTRVAAIRRGSGHLDTAQDLWSLAKLFRTKWSAIGGRVPCTLAEVARAAELSNRLLKALGQRDRGTDGAGKSGELGEQLGKAFELFRRAYEACRHAVVYVRRDEGDADEIAPPLAHSRRRARRVEADEPEPTEPGDADSNGPDSLAPGGGEADGG